METERVCERCKWYVPRMEGGFRVGTSGECKSSKSNDGLLTIAPGAKPTIERRYYFGCRFWEQREEKP